jgi:excisionase family DNA binding protein
MGTRHTSTTFEAARAAWLSDARFRRLSPVTIREYGRISGALLGHLADKVGREPTLDDLRPAIVRTWLNDRQPPLQPASAAAEEIAGELGLSPRTVRRHIQEGRLRARAYLVGGRAKYRVQRLDLDAFLTRFARDTFEPD